MSVESFPEYASIETFVEECLDDERDCFTTHDMQCLNAATRTRLQDVRRELEAYGLRFVPREPRRRVRGYSDNPHDRFHGRGSDPMHGGSGQDQIMGWAGPKGGL